MLLSLVDARPSSADFFVAWAAPVPGGWHWHQLSADPPGPLVIPVDDLEVPAHACAIGLASWASARPVDSDGRPLVGNAVPVLVGFVATSDGPSASVIVYPDRRIVWSPAPQGRIADAAARLLADRG